MSWFGLLVVLAIIVVAVLLLWLWMRRRRRKRREAEFAAAKRVDPSDPNALAAVPIDALDDLSKAIVVDVDNAVRTSDSELALAVEEFGTAQTEPFSRAVTNARTTLAQAFNVRQILDDAVPETPAAAPRPADARGRRCGEGRSGAGRAGRGVREAARSGDQRTESTGRAHPADGRHHRPHRPVGAGAGSAAQPIRRRRTDFRRRQRRDSQAAAGVRRPEHHQRPRAGGASGRPADGSGRRDPGRRVLTRPGPLAARRRRQRGDRHQPGGSYAAVGDRRHPERHQPGRRTAAAAQHAASCRTHRSPGRCGGRGRRRRRSPAAPTRSARSPG